MSPLELAFVETSDPLATSVSADTLEVGVPSLLMEFENVPVDRIDEVHSRAILIIMPQIYLTSAANRLIGEIVQSRRRPLLGPSPG